MESKQERKSNSDFELEELRSFRIIRKVMDLLLVLIEGVNLVLVVLKGLGLHHSLGRVTN